MTAGRQGRDGVGEVRDRREIHPGDSGIWATCGLGKEGKCVGDLKALFEEVSEEETWCCRPLLISPLSTHSVCSGRRKRLAKKKPRMATSRPRLRKSSRRFAILNRNRCLRQSSSTRPVVSRFAGCGGCLPNRQLQSFSSVRGRPSIQCPSYAPSAKTSATAPRSFIFIRSRG